jgi:hypothetical protein
MYLDVRLSIFADALTRGKHCADSHDSNNATTNRGNSDGAAAQYGTSLIYLAMQ